MDHAAERFGRSAADNSASEAAPAPEVDARRLPNHNWNALLAVSCSALLGGVRLGKQCLGSEPTMRDYGEYLQARFQGEVFGEALFSGLAHRSTDEGAKAKWRFLEQLERRTKHRIRPALEALGLPTEEDAARRREGEGLAERLSSVPWEQLMKGMRREFEKYVEEFRRAEALASPDHQELARYITDHERALVEFADRELRSTEDDSLEPVRRLLG